MSEIDRDRELDARLSKAPREADPGRDLWHDLAEAIGATPESRPALESPSSHRARRRIPRLPLQIAAALALFAGGVVVGQRWGAPDAGVEAPIDRGDNRLAAAAEIQRAGSEYVSALSRLDESAGAFEREQGVDAALSTLQGAAWELARLRPDDPQAGRLLYTVSEARTDGEEPTVSF
jgi:hypothetical protein